jgi:hypothetical protein
MLSYILLWLPMAALAIANGAIRDSYYKKYVGASKAKRISTITLLIILGIYIAFVMDKFPVESPIEAWEVGIVWVLMTLAFEFGLGALRNVTPEEMLSEYNIFKGRIWVLIPVELLVVPWLFYLMSK